MKQKLLLLLLFLPLLSFAQTDAKYMENAVPIIDGKVTFTQEMNAASLNKEQIFETLSEWADKRFQPDDRFNDKVLYSNEEEGKIAIGGEEFIVFSSSSFSLDRTRIYYQLHINCQEGKYDVAMTRIRYWYNEARDGGEKFMAEEWITDEATMNKSKTKLYSGNGKFRKKTIDLKDALFEEIKAVTDKKILALGQKPNEQVKTQSVVCDLVPLVPATKPEEKIDTEALIAQAARMTITAGNDEQFEISKDSWGGFGELFGKKVAYCLIDTQKKMGNLLMSQSDTFRISFYSSNSNQPTVTIDCKKLMTQSINAEEVKKMSLNCENNKSYYLYIGEVLK